MIYRPRRNRKSQAIRELVAQTRLHTNDLIMPLFLVAGTQQKQEIKTMPNIYRYSLDLLLKECEKIHSLGIQAIALFPCLENHLKDKIASESYNENGLYLNAIREIKKQFPQLLIITDVAMDPYNSDGHDGLVENGKILNDQTLEILSRMALCQAQAGADIIAPSDMMDGRIGHIRQTLDTEGFQQTNIMSYTIKYASAYYKPFRDALDSTPKTGDKKTYQMDWRNRREALLELTLDEQEGADIVMIKPGIAYLDILADFAQHTTLPIAIYQVSGEYSMIKIACQQDIFNEEDIVLETLTSFKRAGANMIVSYFSQKIAPILK